MESVRQEKINRLLLRDLGTIFQLESRNILGTGAMISVTRVKVSRDLSTAHVHLSLFATDNKQELINQIKNKKTVFRTMLGAKVRHQLRVVPDLIFELDDSLDYIEHIDQLLKDNK